LGANHSPEDRWGGTPLNDATRHGHSEVMTYLKSVGAVLGSMAQEDPATELCNAAHKADLRRLRFLVHKKRYNVNHGDYDVRGAATKTTRKRTMVIVGLPALTVPSSRAVRCAEAHRHPFGCV
jgi:hypothetical protein